MTVAKKATPYRDLSKAKQRSGLISNTRVAWANTYRQNWTIYFYPPSPVVTTDDDGREVIQMMKPGSVRLILDPPPSPSAGLDLTKMTVEELKAAQYAINYAFALALPICRDNDRRAAEALEAGDDSHFRIYRSAPTLVVRQRGQREYLASLQGGLDGLDALGDPPGPDEDLNGRGVGHQLGSPVLDGEPPVVGAPDNPPEAGGDAIVRDGPRLDGLPVGLPTADTQPRHAAPPS